MSRKAKSNIRPENIGALFTDGTDYYKLVSCEIEPQATFQVIGGTGKIDIGSIAIKPISKFAHLVLMKPVKPIEKQAERKERKPRSDRGKGHHRAGKPATTLVRAGTKGDNAHNPQPEITGDEVTLSEPDIISTFSIKTFPDHYDITLGTMTTAGKSLKEGVLRLLKLAGLDQKAVEDAPDSEGKKEILAILKEGK